MAERKAEGFEVINNNIKKPKVISLDKNVTGAGAIPAAVASTVAVAEYGDGNFRITEFTLTDMPMTVRDTEQGNGVQIYNFPLGRILTLGGAGTINVTTTSALATTLNASVTCQWGVGTVTQTNVTLATTEQDLINNTAFTSSATVDVASADAEGVGIGVVTPLNGTSTAKDAFLNIAVATATDIDADATVTISGTIRLAWVNLSS